jgi:hypothetical protein
MTSPAKSQTIRVIGALSYVTTASVTKRIGKPSSDRNHHDTKHARPGSLEDKPGRDSVSAKLDGTSEHSQDTTKKQEKNEPKAVHNLLPAEGNPR